MSAKVWTVGEALAVLVPRGTGPAEQAVDMRVGVGGAELNTAIGLARLGHPVTWVGAVGDDPWGRRVTRELRAEGVDCLARVVPASFTGAYLRERRAAGLVRTAYLRRGSAGSQLDHETIAEVLPTSIDLVHLTGITPALSTTAHAAWLETAQRAHVSGARVSFDVNHRASLCSEEAARTAFRAIAPYLTVAMASIDEVAVVTGQRVSTPFEAAEALRGELSPTAEVVIKDGAAGSLHVGADGSATRGEAVSVTVCDVVGAGDAFAAGYLSGLLDGLPVPQRLHRAHACAAFVVASEGDWDGAPRRHELDDLGLLLGHEVQR